MATRTINKMSMHFQERGQGPAIVLVHGFPLDSRIWDAQIEALSDRYRVIAPDLRGFGQSKSAEPFTMDSLADDVHALLIETKALPCILGGLSMGGYMALAYVLKYASDLRGLMLIDTRAEADTPAGKEARSKMIQSVRTGGAKAVADEMFPKMMFEQLLAKNPAVAMKLRQAMESQNPKTIENAIIALRDRPDRIASLPTIDVPTLVVVGEHDVITPPAMSQTLEKSIPSATLVSIANAGHMSPMEQPDDVTTAIRRFAESVTK